MQPEPKKHVSHAIAWSLIALFAGSLAFGIWMYSNQIDTIYAGSVSISVTHKKTAATKPTTATTGTTTTTDATADWQNYTNDTYGFSFKYPKDGKVNQESKNGADPLTINILSKDDLDQIAKIQGPSDIQLGFTISTHNLNDNTFDSYLSNIENNEGKKATIKNLSNGLSASLIHSEGLNDGVWNYYVQNPKKPSIVATFGFFSENGDQIALTKQILSTFTFTK